MDLLTLLFPKRCVGCNELGSYLCPRCINAFVPLQTGYCPGCRKPSVNGITHPICRKHVSLDGLISCFVYRGVIRKVVAKFKYSLVRDLTETLIELMIMNATHPILFQHTWTLVPVPLHVTRWKWRGFNQAELLSHGLATAWKWPIAPELINRIHKTAPQMKSSALERRQQLQGAFQVNQSVSLPTHVLLIDDVATTCSTLNECAQVLKQAGVEEVWGLTFAQTLPK